MSDSSMSEDLDSVPVHDPDDSGVVQFVSGNGLQVVDDVALAESILHERWMSRTATDGQLQSECRKRTRRRCLRSRG
jgi:hypothetical protein